MFESVLTSTVEEISEMGIIICILVSVILGFIVSAVYMISSKSKKYSANFACTLVVLPVIVTAIIMLIGSDIAKAISLGGVFALVRFRSVPGDSKDIVSVFYCMSVGLACGMGYVVFATFLAAVIAVLYIVLSYAKYGEKKSTLKQLKVTIPEDINYKGLFDDLFEDYTIKATLVKVRTINLGTLYELTYELYMKDDIEEKEFLDSIRCRNNNLNISLNRISDRSDML